MTKCFIRNLSVASLLAIVQPALATLDFDGTPWTLEYDGTGLPTGGASNFNNIAMNSSQYNTNDKFTNGDLFPGWLTASGNGGGSFGKPYPYTANTKAAGWTFEWKSVSVAGTQVTSDVHQINDNDSLLRIDYGANQITLRDGYPGIAGGGMTSVASVNLSGMAEHTFRLMRQPNSPTVELYIDNNFASPAAQVTPFSYAQGFNYTVADETNLNSMYLGNSLYENAYDFVRMHGGATPAATPPPPSTAAAWQVGRPITMYHQGAGSVILTPETAQQAVDGGFNVVWATTVEQLDLAHQYGLRAMWDGSLDADTIKAVSSHPATYSFNLADEPPPAQFHQIGGRMKYMRTIAPSQTSLVTVLPTYVFPSANAYSAYLDDYISTVQPSMLVYDHYNFYGGDHSQYFMNLKLISDKARQAGIPFMNTVQASAWDTGWRVPNEHELRFLNYTSLAYDAQGMNYWAYHTPNPNSGGLAPVNGQPTSVFTALSTINREFVAIAKQVQSLQHIGAYHAGDQPPGTVMLPGNSPFTFSPSVPNTTYVDGDPVKGLLMGLFGQDFQLANSQYALAVNLNYSASKTITVNGPGNLSVFDPTTGVWSHMGSSHVDLTLEPGGGRLVALTGLGSEWSFEDSGDWNAPPNWAGVGGVPNGVGALGNFLGRITAPTTVYTDTPVTVGTLKFDNANTYHITGLGSLTVQTSSGSGTVAVVQGSHKINLPLFFASNTNMTIGSEAMLTIADPMTIRANRTLTKNGALLVSAPLSLEAGASLILASGPTTLFGAPSLGSGAKINLMNNAVSIDYRGQTSPANTIRSQLASGYNNGLWNGEGINTSSAIAGETGLGWRDDPASESISIKYTYYGDIDLSGTVDSIDFSAFVAGYGLTGGAIWAQGDFDYDQKVSTLDFNYLAGNFGKAAIPSAALGAVVPEPMGLSVMGVAAIGLLSRSRAFRRTPTMEKC